MNLLFIVLFWISVAIWVGTVAHFLAKKCENPLPIVFMALVINLLNIGIHNTK